MKMKLMVWPLIASAALAGCAGGFEDYDVAGPVAPPAKTVVRSYAPDIVSESDFLAASGTNTIFFETNKAVLTPQALDTLERQARWLMTHREVAFRVEGHCDERAAGGYNIELGRRRANAVKDYFVDRGISEQRITAVSFGEESPVIDENGDIQINRRAVTVLSI